MKKMTYLVVLTLFISGLAKANGENERIKNIFDQLVGSKTFDAVLQKDADWLAGKLDRFNAPQLIRVIKNTKSGQIQKWGLDTLKKLAADGSINMPKAGLGPLYTRLQQLRTLDRGAMARIIERRNLVIETMMAIGDESFNPILKKAYPGAQGEFKWNCFKFMARLADRGSVATFWGHFKRDWLPTEATIDTYKSLSDMQEKPLGMAITAISRGKHSQAPDFIYEQLEKTAVPEIRLFLIERIGVSEGLKAFEKLKEIFEKTTGSEKMVAVKSIGRTRHKEAFAFLNELIAIGTDDEATSALTGLSAYGTRDAVFELLKICRDESRMKYERQRALDAIACVSNKDAETTLFDLAKSDTDALVRIAAIRGIGAIDDYANIRRLRLLAKDEKNLHVLRTVMIVSGLSAGNLPELAIAGGEDEGSRADTDEIRKQIDGQSVDEEDRMALSALDILKKGGTPDISRLAGEIAGMSGPAALDELIACFKSTENSLVCQTLARRIGELAKSLNALDRVRTLLDELRGSDKAGYLVAIVTDEKPKENVAALAEMLKSGSYPVRKEAARALAATDAPQAADAILAAYRNEKEIRAKGDMLYFLSTMNLKDKLAEFAGNVYKDPADERIAEYSFRMVVKYSDGDLKPLLVDGVKSKWWPVRMHSARELMVRKINSPDVVELLLEMLKNEENPYCKNTLEKAYFVLSGKMR